MSDRQSRRRPLYCALVMLVALLSVAPVTPAAAEIEIAKSGDGMSLPNWLLSASEVRARQACEADPPIQCRQAVRERIAMEKAISRTFPWIALCIIIWIAVRFVQRRDKQRERRRQEAARHHVRASVREKQPRPAQTTNDDDDSLDDGLGVGTPGGKRGGLH